MGNELTVFEGGKQLPAHLQGRASIVENVEVMASSGRLSLAKNRFNLQDNGDSKVLGIDPIEVRFYKINDTMQRQFYDQKYDDQKDDQEGRVICYSHDNVSPAEDAAEPQSDKCKNCPRHSRAAAEAAGLDDRSCSLFRNTVVKVLRDDGAETDLLRFKINAGSCLKKPGGDDVMNLNRLIQLAKRGGFPLQYYPVELDFVEKGGQNQISFWVNANAPANEAEAEAIDREIEGTDLDAMVDCTPFEESSEEDTSAQRAEAPKTRRKKKAAAKAAEPAATEQPESGGESEGEGDEPAPSKSRAKRRGNRGAAKANAAAQTEGVDGDDSDEGGDMGDPELEDLLGGVEDLD